MDSPILPYVDPVWTDLEESKEKKKRAAYCLTARRTCCAYRIIYGKAACVIVRMIPIDILERQPLYDRAHRVKLLPSERRGGTSQQKTDGPTAK